MQKTDDQLLIGALIEYREYINEPGPRWPTMEFDKNSYSRWAVDEIFLAIIKEPEKPIMQVVSEFKELMWKYSMVNPYSEANFTFRIAYDTACDVEDILGGIL